MAVKEIGPKLKKARQAKGIDLEQVAQATRIRAHYLEALEKGEFGLLPSPVQLHGFLRTYARYLDLDPNEILALLTSPATKAEGPPEPTQEVAAPSSSEAHSAYLEIGAQLRERRELLELTHIEIEERIHISERYLSWLESGEFDRFPSPTQARGMLSNYADFLGLPTDELLLRYADALQAQFELQQQRRQAQKALRIPRPTLPEIELPKFEMPLWARRILSPDILALSVFIIVLFGLFIWGITRIGATRAAQAGEPTAPPLAGLLVPTTTPTPEDASAANEEPGAGSELVEVPTQTPQLTVQVANPSGVELGIQPNQRVWARVTVDGSVAFEGRMAPDETYSYTAANEILLYTGNAGGLRVFLNGADLGVLGIQGEVIELVFNRQGLATQTPAPTPTITPTPTEGPTATYTPTPTPTIDIATFAP